MRMFEEPIIEVQKFDVEDVITVSNPDSGSGDNETSIATRPRN